MCEPSDQAGGGAPGPRIDLFTAVFYGIASPFCHEQSTGAWQRDFGTRKHGVYLRSSRLSCRIRIPVLEIGATPVCHGSPQSRTPTPFTLAPELPSMNMTNIQKRNPLQAALLERGSGQRRGF